MPFFQNKKIENQSSDSHISTSPLKSFRFLYIPLKSLISRFGFIRMKRLNIRTLLLYLTSAIVIIVAITIFYLNFAKKIEAAWFDDSWGYRQTVAITNSGSAQTDFQVAITLDSATLITAGKMQSDCDDIRVTDVGGNLLKHVVEEGSAPCNNAATKIWVKVPSIPTSGVTLFVYYGNPGGTNVEDGSRVFAFFDNFNTNSLNAAKWTATGATSFASGAITITTGSVYSNSTILSTLRSYMYNYC